MNDFLQQMNVLAKPRRLKIIPLEDGYGLDYGGGFISKFYWGQEAKLKWTIELIHPYEPVNCC